jgi:hypothetical protein
MKSYVPLLAILSLFSSACGGQVLLGERELQGSASSSSSSSSGSSGAVTHTLSCNGSVDTLVTTCASTQLLAVDDQSVYYQAQDCSPTHDGPKLLSIPRGGGSPTSLVTDYYFAPYGRFIIHDQSIFYTTGNSAFTMPKAGGPAQLLYQAPQPYLGTPVSDGSDIYVASDDGIDRLPNAGGKATVIANELAFALAVDATNLYWLGGSLAGPNPLKAVAKTGGTAVSLAPDLGQAYGDPTTSFSDSETQLRFVRDGDAIYWGNRRDHQLVKYPTSGGAPTVLAQGDVAGWILSIAVYNGWVVWVEGAAGPTRRLFAMPVTGGDARQIASVDGSAWALVPDATGFYFSTFYASPGAVKHISCTWR